MIERSSTWRRMALAMAALALGLSSVALAQGVPGFGPAPTAADETLAPRSRPALRILTDSDFPPFNFIDEEGVLTGFNVDLARAICLETNAACDVQHKPWEELLTALLKGDADAVMAGHAVSSRTLRQVDFTDRYFHTPARFAARRDGADFEATPDGLDGRKIGVAKDTAHEAFVRAFFRDSRIEVFASPDLARDALVAGKIDALLDDGISLSFWLGGTASRDCCAFRGGPFFEPKYFGDGMAIAIAKGDADLRRTINAALKRVRASGRYEELVQRYFPNRVY
jgi:polar amino acid transport system substrate-binding protein